MQFDSVDPANCKAVDSCQYATRPVTRADQIRAMTDEQLAAFLADHPVVSEFDASKSLHMDWLLWLSLEVSEFAN